MRRLLPLTLTLALVPAVTAQAADPAWWKQEKDISCDTSAGKPFYPGPDASKPYDDTFSSGPAIPSDYLQNAVPQGLATLPNWIPGHDLLLQTGYDRSGNASVIGIRPEGGATTALALQYKNGTPLTAHAGGIAVVKKWVYVSGPGDKVLKYRITAVKRALAQRSGKVRAAAEQNLSVGTAGFVASFMGNDGRSVYVGTFDENHRNRMYRFDVSATGVLKRRGGRGSWIQVPKKTQGLAVTGSHFLYSTSHDRDNRANVYVVKRGKKYLDNSALKCIGAPSMTEGFAISGGQAFISFESASWAYPGARNTIGNLHKAPVGRLQAFVP